MNWTKCAVEVPELFSSQARAFEQCVVAGPLIFVSGQVGWIRGVGLVSPELAPQVRQTFANIRAALQAADADLEDLVSMTVYLTDPRHMEPFIEARREILQGSFPTSTMVAVDKLYAPGMLVEISAIAVRSS
jgi:enamine deaminase RidA (YjgF/YER057c/UK114 family)